MLLKEVIRAIETNNMIEEGDVVVAGVSGGADSVTLLMQLAEYRERVDYTLQVFHLNHMIRPDASDDEEFVRRLCKKMDIPFFSEHVDVEEAARTLHMSVEEAGRKIRYDAMRALKPDKIAVGHHRDDLAETVLINMCRGTGLHGMVGIAPVQDDVIRPLIYLTRSQIEDHLKEAGQEYCTDSTNASTDYTRNRIRLDIIPQLTSAINDRTVDHIAAMSEDMLLIEEFIMSQVDRAYGRYVHVDEEGHIRLMLRAVASLNIYITRELILRIIEKMTPARKDITRNHVEGILALCEGDGEKTMYLPYGIKVIRSYDHMIFITERPEDETDCREELIIPLPNLTEGEGWTSVLDDGRIITVRVKSYRNKPEIPNKTYTKWFDYDKIDCSKLYIRHRQAGDYLTVNSAYSKKSLQDYMVNEKIEKYKRETIPLLVQDDHVLWVIGYRVSEYFKLSEDSKRILEVNITQKENDNG